MENENLYPLPQPVPHTAPFWDACQRKSLEVSACNNCNHFFLPGGPVCPKCWSQDLGTRPVSGLGEVFSFVIYRRTYHPAIPAPYVVAIIELTEGVRLVSNVIGCDPEEVKIGMPVQVIFEQESDFFLPRFTPIATSTTPSLKDPIKDTTKDAGEN
jgi:uncharacterized OB-fold protein